MSFVGQVPPYRPTEEEIGHGTMTTDTDKVTVRLPTERLEALEALVRSGKYSTMSGAIRAAIDEFIETQFAPDYIKKFTIELPKGNVVELEKLVKSGDSVSVDDAIRNAVREYIRKRLEKIIKERVEAPEETK